MGESITSIICPECGAERRSERGVRPGMRVRCHKCSTSFVPLPLLDDDDAPLPPPPLPGKGPRRKSIAKKELHGNYHDRFQGSRHSAMIVGGILLAGTAGLGFSIYRQMQHDLDITQHDVAKARESLVDKELGPNPTKRKAQPPAARAEAPVAEKSEQPGEKSRVAVSQPARPAAKAAHAFDPSIMVIKPQAQHAPGQPSATAPLNLFGQAGADSTAQQNARAAAERKARAAAERAALEKAAKIKLDRARKLENDGKPLTAQDRFREILNEFPDTEAAKTARERFDALSKKARK
ncbi:MAG: hypothetical protein ACP5XB_11980 [Isosphaeraceae bacterium]